MLKAQVTLSRLYDSLALMTIEILSRPKRHFENFASALNIFRATSLSKWALRRLESLLEFVKTTSLLTRAQDLVSTDDLGFEELRAAATTSGLTITNAICKATGTASSLRLAVFDRTAFDFTQLTADIKSKLSLASNELGRLLSLLNSLNELGFEEVTLFSAELAELIELFLDPIRVVVVPILRMVQLLQEIPKQREEFKQFLEAVLSKAAEMLSHPVWTVPRPFQGHFLPNKRRVTPSGHVYPVTAIIEDIAAISTSGVGHTRENCQDLIERILRGLLAYDLEYQAGYDTEPSLQSVARDAIGIYQAAFAKSRVESLHLLAQSVKHLFSERAPCESSPELYTILYPFRNLEAAYCGECEFLQAITLLSTPSNQEVEQLAGTPRKRLRRNRSFHRLKRKTSEPGSTDKFLDTLWDEADQIKKRIRGEWRRWLNNIRILAKLLSMIGVGSFSRPYWMDFVGEFYERLVTLEALINKQTGLFLTGFDTIQGLQGFVRLKPLGTAMGLLIDAFYRCMVPIFPNIQNVDRSSSPSFPHSPPPKEQRTR